MRARHRTAEITSSFLQQHDSESDPHHRNSLRVTGDGSSVTTGSSLFPIQSPMFGIVKRPSTKTAPAVNRPDPSFRSFGMTPSLESDDNRISAELTATDEINTTSSTVDASQVDLCITPADHNQDPVLASDRLTVMVGQGVVDQLITAIVSVEPANQASSVRPDKIRVLVAEDHNATAKLMKMALLKLGCEVTLAENGVMAIDAFQNARKQQQRKFATSTHTSTDTDQAGAITEVFDLVLMDGNMPVMGRCYAQVAH